MATRAQALPAIMDVDEFYAWDGDEPDIRYQLIDGEPVAMSPASVPHGVIQANVATALSIALREAERPCVVITNGGVVPRIRSTVNVRIPDLAVTCKPIGADKTIQEMIVAIEILSPSNRRETWEAVRNYTTIPSVLTIIVLDSVHRRVLVLARDAQREWPNEPTSAPMDCPLAIEALGVSVDPISFYYGVPAV